MNILGVSILLIAVYILNSIILIGGWDKGSNVHDISEDTHVLLEDAHTLSQVNPPLFTTFKEGDTLPVEIIDFWPNACMVSIPNEAASSEIPFKIALSESTLSKNDNLGKSIFLIPEHPPACSLYLIHFLVTECEPVSPKKSVTSVAKDIDLKNEELAKEISTKVVSIKEASIKIYVNDVNDNYPIFLSNSINLNVTIEEIQQYFIDKSGKKSLFEVNAIDMDCSAEYSTICSYTLVPVSGTAEDFPFVISSTGLVTPSLRIYDNYNGGINAIAMTENYTFEIIAKDCGGLASYPLLVHLNIANPEEEFQSNIHVMPEASATTCLTLENLPEYLNYTVKGTYLNPFKNTSFKIMSSLCTHICSKYESPFQLVGESHGSIIFEVQLYSGPLVKCHERKGITSGHNLEACALQFGQHPPDYNHQDNQNAQFAYLPYLTLHELHLLEFDGKTVNYIIPKSTFESPDQKLSKYTSLVTDMITVAFWMNYNLIQNHSNHESILCESGNIDLLLGKRLFDIYTHNCHIGLTYRRQQVVNSFQIQPSNFEWQDVNICDGIWHYIVISVDISRHKVNLYLDRVLQQSVPKIKEARLITFNKYLSPDHTKWVMGACFNLNKQQKISRLFYGTLADMVISFDTYLEDENWIECLNQCGEGLSVESSIKKTNFPFLLQQVTFQQYLSNEADEKSVSQNKLSNLELNNIAYYIEESADVLPGKRKLHVSLELKCQQSTVEKIDQQVIVEVKNSKVHAEKINIWLKNQGNSHAQRVETELDIRDGQKIFQDVIFETKSSKNYLEMCIIEVSPEMVWSQYTDGFEQGTKEKLVIMYKSNKGVLLQTLPEHSGEMLNSIHNLIFFSISLEMMERNFSLICSNSKSGVSTNKIVLSLTILQLPTYWTVPQFQYFSNQAVIPPENTEPKISTGKVILTGIVLVSFCILAIFFVKQIINGNLCVWQNKGINYYATRNMDNNVDYDLDDDAKIYWWPDPPGNPKHAEAELLVLTENPIAGLNLNYTEEEESDELNEEIHCCESSSEDAFASEPISTTLNNGFLHKQKSQSANFYDNRLMRNHDQYYSR